MEYLKAMTVAEATAALVGASGGGRILAGGTDLLVQISSDLAAPELIVDIKHIPELAEISAEDSGWRIGAAVPSAAMGEHAALRAAWPGLVEAAGLIGSTQIQGRCTVAGNLCNGSPAADSVPAMVAAGAMVRIAGPDGTRDCPVLDIPAGPGKTTLSPGEFVHSVFLPGRPASASDAYLRFTPRTEMDIAVASAAVSLELDGAGTLIAARVALGAVGPKVILSEEAGAAIMGTTLDEGALAAAAAAASAAASPIDDKRGTIAFRTEVVGVLVRRAARIAYDRARKRQ